MKHLALLIAFAALGGCSLLSPSTGGPGAEPGHLVLFGGTSFGECLGYCVTELAVEGRMAVLVYSGWDTGEAPPAIRHERTLTDAEYARLMRAYDPAALRRADEVYGCPDCADGGAEWVGDETEDDAKRVTFEYGADVGGLGAYIVAMRDLRASFPPPPQR